jgi:hypothetical protein
MALIFGYVGMALFVAPFYFILRLLRHIPIAAVVAAALIGDFVANVTPQILEAFGNGDLALMNLWTTATHPPFWVDFTSLSGAATGVVFWWLAQSGPTKPTTRPSLPLSTQ